MTKSIFRKLQHGSIRYISKTPFFQEHHQIICKPQLAASILEFHPKGHLSNLGHALLDSVYKCGMICLGSNIVKASGLETLPGAGSSLAGLRPLAVDGSFERCKILSCHKCLRECMVKWCLNVSDTFAVLQSLGTLSLSLFSLKWLGPGTSNYSAMICYAAMPLALGRMHQDLGSEACFAVSLVDVTFQRVS